MKTEVAIRTQAVCKDDKGNFWFTSDALNALFCMNSENHVVKYVTSFDEKNNIIDSLYTKAFFYDGKIVLIPCVSEHITIYDIERNEASYIYLEEAFIPYNSVLLSEGEILLFPTCMQDYAWLFSVEEAKLEKIDISIPKDEIENECGQIIAILGDAYDGEKAYFAIKKTELSLIYDVASNSFEVRRNKEQIRYFSAFNSSCGPVYLSYEGDKILFASETKLLIDLPYDTKCNIFRDEFNTAFFRINMTEGVGDICIPLKGNNVLQLNNKMRPLGVINWNRVHSAMEELIPFVEVHSFKNKIYFFPYMCDTLLEYDIEKDCYYYYEFSVEQTELSSIVNELCDREKVFYKSNPVRENASVLDLESFIDYIKRK